MITVDGNEAAASVAYRLSEVIAIYPITPSSPMGELADAWAAERRPNLWAGFRRWWRCSPRAAQRRRARGPPGWCADNDVHRFAGPPADDSEPLQDRRRADAVLHACRRPHAGNARAVNFRRSLRRDGGAPDGLRQLASGSVQEAQDLACIAESATLASRVPFMHFFDGFRTSHEVAKIAALDDDDLAPWSTKS
jgi:pyruvate-ferredoxin/flavodoxin oxidoreductase